MSRTSPALPLLLLMFPFSAVAAPDLPTMADPVLQAFVNRYAAERGQLDPTTLFALPAAPVQSACAVPESLPFRLIGAYELHPDLQPLAEDMRKKQRKSFREAGLNPDSVPVNRYSNVKVTHLEIPCVNGTLTGKYVYVISFDASNVTTTTIPFGNSTITATSTNNAHHVRRVEHLLENGVAAHRDLVDYLLLDSKIETHYDNADMEKQARKTAQATEKLLGGPKLTVTYASDAGTATFIPSMEFKVGAGFLGLPKVKSDGVIISSFTRVVDATHSVMESYSGANLQARMSMKDDKLHGEAVTYMDNFYKKMKLRLDQQPGMDNAREVTINGRDLIETRTCNQNGQQVKMTPCPQD